MTWKLVTLGAGEHRNGADLQTKFEEAFNGSRTPSDAGMFSNHHADHRYQYYFSPGAARIFGPMLEEVDAIDTKAPLAGSVTFLAGDAAAFPDLFRIIRWQ